LSFDAFCYHPFYMQSSYQILSFNVFEEYIDILHLRDTFFAKNKLLLDLYQIE